MGNSPLGTRHLLRGLQSKALALSEVEQEFPEIPILLIPRFPSFAKVRKGANYSVY